MMCALYSATMASRLMMNRLVGAGALQVSPFRSYGHQESPPRKFNTKPRNAGLFAFYFKEQMLELKKQQQKPDGIQKPVSLPLITVAEMFRNLGEQEKTELQLRQSKFLQQALDEWNSLSDAEKSAIVEERTLKATMKKIKQGTKQLKAELKSTDRPKRPASIYLRFIVQRMIRTKHDLGEEDGGKLQVIETVRAIAEDWKLISPEDYNKLKEEYVADLEAYRNKKKTWFDRLAKEDKRYLRRYLRITPKPTLKFDDMLPTEKLLMKKTLANINVDNNGTV